MSNYYAYQDVCARIAEQLMKKEGWSVYGYHEDESDAMVDYWSPAYWGGVAEKNGYVLCVNVYGSAKPTEVRKYNTEQTVLDAKAREKISKLEQVTVLRGASLQEEETARKAIEKIRLSIENTEVPQYIVTGIQPGHMAHPPRCNWHIEKDGKYILKGNGLLKFRYITDYYRYPSYHSRIENFKANPNAFEEGEHKSLEDAVKLIKEFENWLNKIDCACGATLGNGEYVEYETVTKTEYKTEIKPFQTTNGSLKDGQCFMLLGDFTYGRNKGLVYRIHEYNGNFYAYKLNGKYTKECTGSANRNNHWYTFGSKFTEWLALGYITWCELREVKTPYEVEKVVKKVIKPDKATGKATESNSTAAEDTAEDVTQEKTAQDTNGLTYNIAESEHTKTHEKIWLVKVLEKLSRDDYIKVNEKMRELGGYYSKFTHSFIFKENPRAKLQMG